MSRDLDRDKAKLLAEDVSLRAHLAELQQQHAHLKQQLKTCQDALAANARAQRDLRIVEVGTLIAKMELLGTDLGALETALKPLLTPASVPGVALPRPLSPSPVTGNPTSGEGAQIRE
jgi:hypothetical protein